MEELSFVTHSFIYKDVLEEIMKDIDLVKIQLYNSIFMYEVKREDISEKARRLINKISYTPLNLSFEDVNNGYPEDFAPGIRTFIPTIVKNIYNILPDSCETIIRDKLIISFIPKLNGNKIYISNDEYTYVDLSKYKGYTFLSDDPICPYVLTTIRKNVEVHLLDYIYAIANEDVGPWLNIIQDKILKFRTDGYIALHSKSIDEMNCYIELAHEWNGEVKRVENSVIIKSTIDFGIETRTWYRLNSKKVLEGDIPSYHINLKVPHILKADLLEGKPKVDDNTNWNFEISQERLVKLKYMCVLSYLSLTDIYPELIYQVDSIEIFNDMTVRGKFYSYDQVKHYLKLLDEYDYNDDLNVVKVKSYREGLELRLQIEENLYDSFIISIENSLYVVTNYTHPIDNGLIARVEKGVGMPIEEAVQYDISGNKRLPEISGLGYFNNMVLKGRKDFQEVPVPILPNINLTKSIVENTIVYYMKLEKDEFLISDNDIDYISPNEILWYDNEVSISGKKGSLFEDSLEIRTLYEGMMTKNSPLEEKIVELWSTGFFMTNWQIYIYRKYKKVSRLPFNYYTD